MFLVPLVLLARVLDAVRWHSALCRAGGAGSVLTQRLKAACLEGFGWLSSSLHVAGAVFSPHSSFRPAPPTHRFKPAGPRLRFSDLVVVVTKQAKSGALPVRTLNQKWKPSTAAA